MIKTGTESTDDQKESKCTQTFLKPDNILTVKDGKYSSLVAVGRLIQVKNDGTVFPYCTATKLKDEYTILTAAHCFLKVAHHDNEFFITDKQKATKVTHLRFCPVYSKTTYGKEILQNYKWCIPVEYVYVKIVFFSLYSNF